ncbi:uncharacterized protein METZ01_LOCUS144332 [marine metagenome]|uniref:Uncharacterized protein n=1 Tax=marine metagenome TaxID=408172 RepID=A0A381ZQA7_9ZZZZ
MLGLKLLIFFNKFPSGSQIKTV